MEYIKKEELKDGDVFVSQMSRNHFLNKYGTGYSLHLNLDNTIKDQVLYRNGGLAYNNMRLATPEEKHWLNEAIKLDKFITFEEAIKSFIPEYVELINTGCRINCNIPAGKIYKCSKDVTKDYHFGFFLDSKYRIGFNKNEFNQYLKPSTKEAYDAQFVVKEPEFVLPEKWCIKSNNKEELEKVLEFKPIDDCKDTVSLIYYRHFPILNNNYTCYPEIQKNYVEITFEQFKKYVLKEEIVVEEVIEPLPQFKIIETIETITKVENNEGNQFFIGDVVKTEAGLHFKIIGFKYDENKTKILAIATDNYPEVVKDINDIEHYIEPKVEETLLEKAKRLYPIGTKFINPNDNEECVIKEKGNYFKGNNNNIYHSIANTVFKYEEGLSGCIYINNTWSKIIE